MKLREIAHSRTGDKGNASNISVIAYDSKHYPLLLEQVTSEWVKAHFTGVVEGEVVRYELPNIVALNFVMTGTTPKDATHWSIQFDGRGKRNQRKPLFSCCSPLGYRRAPTYN